EQLHAIRRAAADPFRRRQVARVHVQRLAHQPQPRENQPAEVQAVPVERVDRHGGAGVYHAQGAAELGLRTDHRHPTVHPHAARIPVTVRHAETPPLRAREMHLAVAMDADDARQPGRERLPGRVAREHRVHVARQVRSQRTETGFTELLVPDAADLAQAAAVQHGPLDARIADVEEQRTHGAHAGPPTVSIEPVTTRCIPRSVCRQSAPSESMPDTSPSSSVSSEVTRTCRPRSQSYSCQDSKNGPKPSRSKRSNVAIMHWSSPAARCALDGSAPTHSFRSAIFDVQRSSCRFFNAAGTSTFTPRPTTTVQPEPRADASVRMPPSL